MHFPASSTFRSTDHAIECRPELAASLVWYGDKIETMASSAARRPEDLTPGVEYVMHLLAPGHWEFDTADEETCAGYVVKYDERTDWQPVPGFRASSPHGGDLGTWDSLAAAVAAIGVGRGEHVASYRWATAA